MLSAAPYWNWNYIGLLCGDLGSSFSCTILELKRERLGHFFRWNCFQLHHTGIETRKVGMFHLPEMLSAAPYWNWNNVTASRKDLEAVFQLHHTGIETWKNKNRGFRIPLSAAPYWNWNTWALEPLTLPMVFQLHHTGIETVILLALFGPNHSFSCTILELKHIKGIGNVSGIALSAAPYWNWNKIYWLCRKRLVALALSAAPYWNWNIGFVFQSHQYLILSAAPYWNWNMLAFVSDSVLPVSFSCTILELKHVKIPDKITEYLLSAAPYWNWNVKKRSWIFERIAFQLHHTGIETFQQLTLIKNCDLLSAAPYWNWNGVPNRSL